MPATTGKKTNRGTRKNRRAGRSSKKRLRLALFSDSLKLSRSLSSSSGPSETVELTRFDPSSFTTADWVAEPYDAVIVEQRPAAKNANGLIRWLRKTNPSVPLIALGPSTNNREPDARSVYALHLSEVPRKGVLRSLVRDAQRHLEATRKASKLSRRLRETSRRLQVLGDIVSTANSILEPRRVRASLRS